MKPLSLLLLVCLAVGGCGGSGPSDMVVQVGGTELERLAAQDGAVVVTGFTAIGELSNDDAQIVTVTVRQVHDVSSDKWAKGLEVDVSDHGDIGTSYVDYDEIAGLSQAIDDLATIKRNVTRLQDMQARFRTRGGLLLVVFSYGDEMRLVVSCGDPGGQTAYFGRSRIKELRKLVADAKQKLDELEPRG